MLFWSVVRIFSSLPQGGSSAPSSAVWWRGFWFFWARLSKKSRLFSSDSQTALRFSHVWGCCDALLDLHTPLISYILCIVVYSKREKTDFCIKILVFSPPFPFSCPSILAEGVFFLFTAFTIRCNSEITQLMQWLPCSTTVPHKADRNLNGWINADHSSTKTKPEKGRTFLFSDGTKSLLIGWKWQEGVLLNTGPLKCPRLMYLGEVSHPDVFLQV